MSFACSTPAGLAGLFWCTAVALAPASAQTAWSTMSPVLAPAARTAHGLVYHKGIQRTVLFGGCDNSNVCHKDTWTWDGTNWTLLATSGSPSSRYGHFMVYDSDRDVIVLFGGGTVSRQLFRDTWEFDGSAWTQRAAAGPDSRWNHGMAYDPVRKKTVLFGGNDLTTSFGDTWEWDGTRWTQRFPAVRPPARMGPAMAWDGSTDNVILHGGYGWGTSFLITSDTWLWDGNNWSLKNFTNEWAANYAGAMTWDEARELVVFFGGVTLFGGAVGYQDTTGEWGWPQRWWRGRLTGFPAKRAWSPLAYDSDRRQVVMFGGSNNFLLGDTNEYAPMNPATFANFGAGCAGSAGTPAISSTAGLPWRGDQITVSLENLPPGNVTALALGVSSSQWGPVPLPLSLGSLAPGCTVLASQELVVPLANPTGTASLSMTVPSAAGPGSSFYLQGIVIDPVNLINVTLSDAAHATIGIK